jgi:formyl-CoA transferase
VRVGVSLGDSVAAMLATIGALSALNRRQETGRGDVIDIALHEAVFALLEGILPEYSVADLVRERAGNVLPGSAPTSTYPTRDGKYISIGANSDSIFPRLCRLMEQPDLATDPHFADNQSRRRNVAELDSIIQEWTLTRDLADLWHTLNEAQVPAGPVYSIDDIARDPQFLARDMILPVEVDGVGEVLMPGVVPKLAGAPGSVRWPGPPLGAHTDLVLAHDLGFSRKQIDELHASGAVGGGTPAPARDAWQPA